MAVASVQSPRVTQSGVTIRYDCGIDGLVCFVPQPGMIYALPQTESLRIAKWLDGDTSQDVADIYRVTLGQRALAPGQLAVFPAPQLLPDMSHWPTVGNPDWPLLVNWFITGRCPLACKYCYAEDLMRDDSTEPTPKQIPTIARAILRLKPVAVVLTGGDPLFSPNLEPAIEELSGRVGIIVDTSGFTLRDHHLDLFVKHNISLRVSLDSQMPADNDFQRPISPLYPKLVKHGGTLASAVDAVCRALDCGIGVTVQSVATKKTANDLVGLGDVLCRLGVRSWRIFKVSPSTNSMEGYRALVGSHMDDGRPHKGKRRHGPYEHAFARVVKERETSWKGRMAVQVTMNDVPNSVILVTPDGRFVTESNTGRGKIELDPRNPRSPSKAAIHTMINMTGHAARYLNMTST